MTVASNRFSRFILLSGAAAPALLAAMPAHAQDDADPAAAGGAFEHDRVTDGVGGFQRFFQIRQQAGPG